MAKSDEGADVEAEAEAEARCWRCASRVRRKFSNVCEKGPCPKIAGNRGMVTSLYQKWSHGEIITNGTAVEYRGREEDLQVKRRERHARRSRAQAAVFEESELTCDRGERFCKK